MTQNSVGNADQVTIERADFGYTQRYFFNTTLYPTHNAKWAEANNVANTKLALGNDVQASNNVAHHLLCTKTQTGTCD